MNVVNEKNASEVAKAIKDGVLCGPSTVRRSLSIANLAAALAKAQSQMENPTRDKVNPHLKSHYADLAAVRKEVLPPLLANGLVLAQLPCQMDDAPALTSLLVHPASGEWVETTIKLPVAKPGSQEVGSALTYARRYALQALGCVAAEDDDDGHAAGQPQRRQSLTGALLREQFREWFECAETREKVVNLTVSVGMAKKAGGLSEYDCAILRPVAEKALARFPASSPAKA